MKDNYSLLIIILILNVIFRLTLNLGQAFTTPDQNKFQTFKQTTLTFFNQNTSYSLPFPLSMSSIPDSVISFDTFNSNHQLTRQYASQNWYYIKITNISVTSINIIWRTFNQTKQPEFEYHTFRILLSSLGKKVLHLYNYEYMGPRLYNNSFWTLTLDFVPEPYGQCFIDQLKTKRTSGHFLIYYNGFVASNLLYINRQTNPYPNYFTFHVYTGNMSLPFRVQLYSDHGGWIDKYFFGFLFYCPFSYLLRRQYTAQPGIVNIGDQTYCTTYSNIQNEFFLLKNDYNYKYFIGMRFIFPNVYQVQELPFMFNFDIIRNGLNVYYNISKICGRVQYNIFFLAKKYCLENRQLNYSSGICICNASNNLYQINSTQVKCRFICPNGKYNFNMVCLTCEEAWGSYCLECDNLTCTKCANNFVISNKTCECKGDRVVVTITNTCELCSSLYGTNCLTCNSTHCLSCPTGYKLLPTNNPSCTNCQSKFGSNCLDCSYTKCLSCQNNFIISASNGSCYCPVNTQGYLLSVTGQCSTCAIQFNQHCLSCTSSSCLACTTNFTLISNVKQGCVCDSNKFIDTNDNKCKLCSEKYGTNCLKCNNTHCLSCPQNYTLFFLSTPSCINCQSSYGSTCFSCSSTSCLTCSNNYLLSQTNGSCYCPTSTSEYIITSSTNLCKTCIEYFNKFCLTCNQLHCTLCKENFTLVNTSNITGINDSCVCGDGRYLNTVTDQCLLCSQIFGIQCSKCNQSHCTECRNNFILSSTSKQCLCSSPTNIIINQTCTSCSILYHSMCIQCSSNTCLKCKSNYSITNNSCSCQIDRFLYNDKCFICSQIYGTSCQQCNQYYCLSCKQNYIYKYDKTCVCQKPNDIRINNQTGKQQCVLCDNIYGKQQCTLSIYATYRQIGGAVYIGLKFNHQLNKITQLVPLQQNLQVYQDQIRLQNENIKWNKKFHYIKIDLSQLATNMNSKNKNNIKLNTTIINPHYIKYNSISLSNQPIPYNFKKYDNSYFQISIINFLIQYIQYIYLFSLLFSFGSLNSGFQMWILFSFFIYIRNDFDGVVEDVLSKLNQRNVLQIFGLEKLGFTRLEFENVDFREVIFFKNQGILQLSLQGFILYFISIGFVVYLKKYIMNKNNSQKYGVYVNFLRHYKEYILGNLYSLYPILSFYLAIQFQYLFAINWNIHDQSVFINTIISCILLLILIMLPLITLNIFPMLYPNNRHSYSIIYNKIHPIGKFQLLEFFMKIYQGPIFIIIIFLFRQSQQSVTLFNGKNLISFILISITGFNIFLIILNYGKYISKLYWLIKFIKYVLFLGFQIGFMLLTVFNNQSLNNEDGSQYFNLNEYCLILIVILLIYDVIQLLVKVIRIFVTNRINYEELYYQNVNKIQPLNVESQVDNNKGLQRE